MRLLIFSYKLPPVGGGTAAYTESLATGLAELGHRVAVLAPADASPGTRETGRARSFIVHRMRLPEGQLRYVVGALFLLWHLVRFRPHALIMAENAAQYAASLAMIVGPPRLSYALTVHSEAIEQRLNGTRGSLKRRLHRRLLRRLYLRARSVICVSEHTRNAVLNALPELGSRAVTIHNGINLRRFSAATNDRQEYVKRTLDDRGPVLLTVARLVPDKGLDTVLSALPELVQEFAGLRYVVVGAGDDRERLERLVHDFALEDCVLFAGYASGTELHAWYEACDVFVMLSRREAFPFVFLEAAACGKPIVAARVGGVPEFIEDGHNGLLVEPDDPRAAAAAIRRLLRDPELRAQMGAGGHKLVEQHFTAHRMAHETLTVIFRQSQA